MASRRSSSRRSRRYNPLPPRYTEVGGSDRVWARAVAAANDLFEVHDRVGIPWSMMIKIQNILSKHKKRARS